MSEKKKRKKIGKGVCDWCGKEQPFCFICINCGFTICQKCFIENQHLFTRSGVTWVCINCCSWQSL